MLQIANVETGVTAHADEHQVHGMIRHGVELGAYAPEAVPGATVVHHPAARLGRKVPLAQTTGVAVALAHVGPQQIPGRRAIKSPLAGVRLGLGRRWRWTVDESAHARSMAGHVETHNALDRG